MTSAYRAPLLRFRLPDGSFQDVLADGSVYTVMQAAKRAGVPGIEGQCGGFRACATCHVHVAEAWRVAVGPPGDDERELLELTEAVRPESRLACQIRITPALDGVELTPAP
jgi:2Fe-2S ferredoxin